MADAGGADGANPDAGKGNEGVDDFDDADEADKDLGDAGKRALASERAARSRAEREAKTHKAELDKLRAGSQTENEKAIAKAREEAKTEALAEVRLERARDKVELRASAVKVKVGKDEVGFADPEDAAVFLGDLSRFVDDKDGSIDTKEIDRELAELLKRKPHLAGAGSRPRGGADGGARGTGGGTPGMNDLIRRGAGYR